MIDLIKSISFLIIALLLLVSCKDETVDYSAKRPAALSLPEIKKDGIDETSSAALSRSISLEEAVSRSNEVFEGSTLSIDSSNYKGANGMPVYLFNVRVKKRMKGNFAEGSNVSLISRSLKVSDVNQENVFFLMPVDSENVFATGNKLHWQWTLNAPQNVKANDSIRALLVIALAKEG